MRRWFAIAVLATTPLFVSSDASADPPANEFQLAAGYAAKEACSCVFVAGQSDAYCTSYATVPTGVTLTVTIDHAGSAVTASYVTATRTATFTSGQGCVLAGL